MKVNITKKNTKSKSYSVNNLELFSWYTGKCRTQEFLCYKINNTNIILMYIDTGTTTVLSTGSGFFSGHKIQFIKLKSLDITYEE